MILCTPIVPARTGNGLAMRAGVLLESLAAAGPVDLVVVPVSGPAVPLDWADLSTAADHGQLDLWGNECEGMCGV